MCIQNLYQKANKTIQQSYKFEKNIFGHNYRYHQYKSNS